LPVPPKTGDISRLTRRLLDAFRSEKPKTLSARKSRKEGGQAIVTAPRDPVVHA
jgi:hypothetical protein